MKNPNQESRWMLERLALDPPKGLVIRSAKAAGFIAGADIKEFQGFDEKGTVGDAIRRGQQVFQRLAEQFVDTFGAKVLPQLEVTRP